MNAPLIPKAAPAIDPMKTFAFVVALLPAALAQPTDLVVLETGPHHRLVGWIEARTEPDGQIIEQVHRYTELATGLHHWNEETGQWLESVEAFERCRKVTRWPDAASTRSSWPGTSTRVVRSTSNCPMALAC